MQTEKVTQRSMMASKAVRLVNEDPKTVARLLGPRGKKVLADTVAVIRRVALREQWPMHVIRVHPVRDPEVQGWEYVVIIVSFTTEFDAASHHIRQAYPDIDEQIDRWTAEEQESYWRLLSLDFEATSTLWDSA